MSTYPNPVTHLYPTRQIAGAAGDIEIVQPLLHDRQGQPLKDWLNPPIICIPVSREVYDAIPHSENEGGYKILADSKMHTVFYVRED